MKMKGEARLFPTWFTVLYIYRDGEEGLAMGRARGHRAAKATVRSGEIV